MKEIISNHPSSPFITQTIHLDVALQPSELDNVKQNIATHVRSLMLKYDASVKGVILSFHNVRLENGNTGTIYNNLSHVNYQVQSDVLAFCPKVGDVLKGKVNACFATHVAITMYSLFAVIIHEDSLVHSGYEYSSSNGRWVHTVEDNSNAINVGMHLEFIVHKVHACDGNLSIEGKV